MAYSISFEPVALRKLNKLDKNIQTRLKPKIFALKNRAHLALKSYKAMKILTALG